MPASLRHIRSSHIPLNLRSTLCLQTACSICHTLNRQDGTSINPLGSQVQSGNSGQSASRCILCHSRSRYAITTADLPDIRKRESCPREMIGGMEILRISKGMERRSRPLIQGVHHHGDMARTLEVCWTARMDARRKSVPLEMGISTCSRSLRGWIIVRNGLCRCDG